MKSISAAIVVHAGAILAAAGLLAVQHPSAPSAMLAGGVTALFGGVIWLWALSERDRPRP